MIIFEVLVMNNSLKAVCDKHNINFSSAKNVIQIYKKEGRLEKKSIRIRKGKKHFGSVIDPEKSEEADNNAMSDEEGKETEVSVNKNFLILQMGDDDKYFVTTSKKWSK
jgi:3-phenylpropionate/cinnamic acid dioxygenase small subunit